MSEALARVDPPNRPLTPYLRPSKWPDAKMGASVEASEQMGLEDASPDYAAPAIGNYRIPIAHDAATAGVLSLPVATDGQMIDVAKLIKHDFYGLLRFSEDGIPAGAYRNESTPTDGTTQQIEVEYRDGSIKRFWTPR